MGILSTLRSIPTRFALAFEAMRRAPSPPPIPRAKQSQPVARTATSVAAQSDAQGRTLPNLQIINDWIVPSTMGWDLDSLQAAVLSLENGNLYAAHSLMLAMTRDATVAHGLTVRRMSLSALPWKIEFPPSIPKAAQEALLKHWPDAITPQDLATASGYTVMLGLAPSAQQWFEVTEATGEKYWQFRSEILETGYLQFRADLRKYFFIARSGYLEVVDDGNAWVVYKSLGDRRHHLDCAVRTLATLWFITQEAIRYHRAYNAEYGRPVKALMVPDQHRLSEDVARLVEQASGLYGGSTIILPQFAEGMGTASFNMKLIEAKSKGFATFSELAKTCRDLITLYLVGVLETTGGHSASNAKAQTQLKVADRYTAADARIREDAINRILRRWAEFNGFEDAPIYSIDTSPPADEALKAQTAKDRAAAIKATADALKAMSDWVKIDEPRVNALMREIGIDFAPERAQPVSPYLANGLSGEHASGAVLVVWEVPHELALELAVPGGEAPEELHLTFALCPESSLADVLAAMVGLVPMLEPCDALVAGVASWPVTAPESASPAEARLPTRAAPERPESSESTGELEEPEGEGEDTGRGQPSEPSEPGAKRSTPLAASASDVVRSRSKGAGSQGTLAYVSLVDAPSLTDMQVRIVKALSAVGVDASMSHGFIPHITRAYLPEGSSIRSPSKSYPIHISQLSVWAMGGKIRVPMALIDEPSVAEHSASI